METYLAPCLFVLAGPALILLAILALNRWDEWRDRRRPKR